MMENCRDNMMVLKDGLEKTGRFEIVSKDEGVPLVAFTLKDHNNFNEFQISDMLKRHGWIIPAYTMPPDAEHVTVLRVVIREDFSRTFAERLVIDITKVIHELDLVPSRVVSTNTITVSAGEEDADNDGTVTIANKSVLETQRKITTAWKKFVMDRKKTNGVC